MSPSRLDRCLNFGLKLLDRTVKVCEPFYALLAAVLVLLDAYTFFTVVIQQVVYAHGTSHAVLHGTIGIWLLFNVAWNHALCIFTAPGCTRTCDLQELNMAAAANRPEWRWCHKCDRPKPPLSHHCSICEQCVLKMDHHCPWMANCVGHYNYKYFFLYLFYMWVGSAYSAIMSWLFVKGLLDLDSRGGVFDNSFLPFLTFLLACAVFLALCGLFGWHVVLVVSGQGTIDALSAYVRDKEAKEKGVKPVNPYHLGAAGNWKECFDVSGPMWWLTWMLPSWRRKRGNGFVMPRAAAGAGASAASAFHAHYSAHVHDHGRSMV